MFEQEVTSPEYPEDNGKKKNAFSNTFFFAILSILSTTMLLKLYTD